MKKKESGKIYVAPLNFELGFVISKFMDYTDIAPFDGALVYVYKKKLNSIDDLPTMEEIGRLEVLFGPVPLNKRINEKGKGAWKYVGALRNFDEPSPVFKDTNEIITLQKAKDWSKVGGWRKRYFNKGEGPFKYEDVRRLEMLTLYDMRDVEIRASMHFMILNKLSIGDYYDLKDEKIRRIYLQMINTSFDERDATKYLSAID